MVKFFLKIQQNCLVGFPMQVYLIKVNQLNCFQSLVIIMQRYLRAILLLGLLTPLQTAQMTVNQSSCGNNKVLIGLKCQCKEGSMNFHDSCLNCPDYSQYSIQKKICICQNGYKWDSDYFYCEKQKEQISCGFNQISINGKCQCQVGTVIFHDSCLKCPDYSNYSKELNKCVCQQNYKWDNDYFYCQKKKIKCKYNQVVDNGVCKCKNGTVMWGSSCLKCPDFSIYNSISNKCQCFEGYLWNNDYFYCEQQSSLEIKCDKNQVMARGKCYCKRGTIFFANECLECPLDSEYDNEYNTCKCIQGYYWNRITFSCNKTNAAKNVKVIKNNKKCGKNLMSKCLENSPL